MVFDSAPAVPVCFNITSSVLLESLHELALFTEEAQKRRDASQEMDYIIVPFPEKSLQQLQKQKNHLWLADLSLEIIIQPKILKPQVIHSAHSHANRQSGEVFLSIKHLWSFKAFSQTTEVGGNFKFKTCLK